MKLAKQKKISNWLKGLDILLSLMVLTFFVGVTYAKLNIPDLFYRIESTNVFLIFAWIVAICIFVVLFEFWKVCTQIGMDNSFSIENSEYFHHMTISGVVAAITFLGRIIWILIAQEVNIMSILIIAVEIILSLMFAVLAEAMSKLILNAYEMKHENDLTI